MNHQPANCSFTAIARDPRTIFVYWDAGCFGGDKLTGKPGANVRAIIAWKLRVRDRSTGEDNLVGIDPATGKHYLHNLAPGHCYEISLCQQDTMRDLHTIARAAPLTLPENTFSALSSPDWEVTMEGLAALLGDEGRNYLGSSGLFLNQQ